MPYKKKWWRLKCIKRNKRLAEEKERLFDENAEYERTLQAARDKVDFATILPIEVTEAIFSYLSVRDLRSCSTVSIVWHEMTNSSLLWRLIAEDKQYRRSGLRKLLDKDQLTSVDSNFLNELKRFRVPSGAPRLSPMNDWKKFHCQNNFLLYNWERGFFAAHVLTLVDNMVDYNSRILQTCRVTFPSKLPKDRIFLPYQNRCDSVSSAFYLLRLDGEPRIACEVNLNAVVIACVNRDCLVFVHNKKVETTTLGENNSTSFKIKTIGELFTESDYYKKEEDNNGSNYFLTMDDNVIVAGFKYNYIKVWCRTTHVLKKTFKLPCNGHYFSYCHFHDSTLYFSTWTNNNNLRPEAELKIWDMEEDKVNMIVVKREVTKVCSNKRYFLSVTKLNVNSNMIEVREREDYNMVTMSVEQDNSENWGIAIPVVILCGERVLYLQSTTIKVMSLALNTVFDAFSVGSVIEIEKLVGNLLMVRLRDKIEVWDWKKGVRLYTPVFDCAMDFSVYCDDTRIVVVSPLSQIKVIGFW